MTSGQEARSLLGRLAQATSRAIHTFEKQPAESDAFLRRLLRNLPGMAYRCANDEHWTMEFVSTGCRSLTGFAPADLMQSRVVTYATLIHPEDRDRVWAAVQEAIDSQKPFEITYRIRRADGQERRVWEQGCAVHDDSGAVEALEGFVTDVTDVSALQEQAWDREAQLRAISEQRLAGVYLIRSGRFQYVNPYLAELLGYEIDELLAMDQALEIVHPEDRTDVGDRMRAGLTGPTAEAQYEFRTLTKDGSVRHLEAHGHRIDFEGRPAVMGLLIDVTARKAAERRYHEAQKMEALGRMATGVAHDLNNFLGSIRSSAELMLVERSEDATLAEELYQIIAAVERGAGLSRQLMDFGRAAQTGAGTTSVGVVLEDLVPMLSRAMGAHVKLRAQAEPSLPEVLLSQSHLQQILSNLVLNAGDAIEENGQVTISVARGPTRGGTPAEETDGAVERVVIEVSDDGVGISEEVRGKIFEPYFTTKGDAGTGLGLANVWRIVQDAGGSIAVDSTLGVGTTFKVVLPAEARRG